MQTPHGPSHGRQAAELFAAHLELIGKDISAWAELFAENAVIEFPYATSVGTPARLEGKTAIAAYVKGVLSQLQGLTFSNVRVFPAQAPHVLFAEVHGEATLASTGLRYVQDYVMRLETDGERILYYREYWNPVPVLQAFGGAQSLQHPVNAV
ncbi:nuclear transport factor 2 family protein [Stigmatella sp. ncwal1]|uniref:Nuclear transport factor 2 family protein n=1 Tax=Stigmatella ashevillensis TaxID=2995309 RepID=A0ABT5DEI2_9BACT|nr:nuclear transport factor 2 family protein [Stigmatella ashevillena]MDC0712090.1 nuclear transport factor 2 family protein [Stigmatella ashevillena]